MSAGRQNFISAAQIRAARALLDWSQDVLAEAAQLSVATIRKIELGHISPRSETTGSIIAAFENAGLEFIEPDGVRHRPEEIRVYQGREGVKGFFDDVYETMKSKGGELVLVCHSARDYLDNVMGEYHDVHVPRMTALRGKMTVKCILINDDGPLWAADYYEYRRISSQYVDSVPFYVYDDKYAIIFPAADASLKIIVIQSRTAAEAFRRQFDSMWDKATPLNAADKAVPPKARSS